MTKSYIPTFAFGAAAMIMSAPSMSDAFVNRPSNFQTDSTKRIYSSQPEFGVTGNRPHSRSISFLDTHQKHYMSSNKQEDNEHLSPSKITEKRMKKGKRNTSEGLPTKPNIISLESIVQTAVAGDSSVTTFGITKNNLQERDDTRITTSDERKDLLPISDLQLGSYIEGQVAHFSNFGVFVKTDYTLSGGYALLHKSQIPGKKKNWQTNFRPGQKMSFRVASINYETAKIGLSLQKPPRTTLKEVHEGMEITDATVLQKTQYGVFVDVGCDVNVLVHKSRIGQLTALDELEVGQEVKIRILRKDEHRSQLEGSMLTEEEDMMLNKKQTTKEDFLNIRREQARKEFTDADLQIFTDAMEELRTVLDFD